jgi:hypothetical protein
VFMSPNTCLPCPRNVREGRGEGIRSHTTMLCCRPELIDNIAGENMGSTRKGMLNVLIAAVLWGSSGFARNTSWRKPHFFALPDHDPPAVHRRYPAHALLRSR